MVIQLDTLIAQGNTSDVYRWGADAVVKVLLNDIPNDWADREAQIAERVHAAGLPAPAVLDVITVNGRPAIVFELVEGISMWEQMLMHPMDIRRLSRILADLQADVNSTSAPAGLPGLNDRLLKNIERNTVLDPSERKAALDDLADKPDDDKLCHFDMHPNNILMGPKGPIIIDWFDAAAGAPAADVARSSVLMRPDAATCHLPCPEPSIIGLVHDEYIAAVLRNNAIDIDQLLEWESSVLASRMSEPLVEACRLAAARTWHALRVSEPTPLFTSIGTTNATHPSCGTEPQTT
jgi:tRNA A-37 threonylcarbamoyl transferase component Bud32